MSGYPFWSTPQELLDAVETRFGTITVDLAADARNHVCDVWIGPDGEASDAFLLAPALAFVPQDVVWCNPPYSPMRRSPYRLLDWAQLCGRIADASGATVLMLAPASTSSAWFADVAASHDVMLLTPRVGFFDPAREDRESSAARRGGARHDSMLAVFDGGPTPCPEIKLWRWRES